MNTNERLVGVGMAIHEMIEYNKSEPKYRDVMENEKER